jgi:class 3 adenylate cyclase
VCKFDPEEEWGALPTGDHKATARLASLAGPGELLISVAVADRASLDQTGFERPTVEVRGRAAALDLFAIDPMRQAV